VSDSYKGKSKVELREQAPRKMNSGIDPDGLMKTNINE